MVIPGPAGDIPARGYLPTDDPRELPTIVYFHGGGWVIGDLDSHDAVCRAIANRVPTSVLSVDYRLAPEATYPAAAEDCYAALEWISGMYAQQGGPSDQIAVAGDSAGGNLAAVVSQMARDRGGPQIAAQILIYPVTDFNFETESYKVNGGGEYGLSEAGMRWFWDLYLNDESEGAQPYASPLQARDLLEPTASPDDHGRVRPAARRRRGLRRRALCRWRVVKLHPLRRRHPRIRRRVPGRPRGKPGPRPGRRRTPLRLRPGLR